MFNKRIKIKELLAQEPKEQEVTVMGWVRTFRNNQFIALNDGSTNTNLQVVVELGKYDDEIIKRITTSASLKVNGIVVPSLGKGQKMDLKATKIEILGNSDAERYPLQPKKHSLEFLREIAHLRFRTNTFGSVFRVRHALAFAVHKFFNDKGFVYMHTPIITASDAEGAGEMFRVTTLPINNVQLRNKRLEKLAEVYERKVVDFLKSRYNLTDLNQRIKSIEQDFDFSKILKAKPADLQKLSKNRKKFVLLINYFNELYSLLKGFAYDIDNNQKEVYTQFLKEEVLGLKKDYEIKRRFSKEKHPYLAFSFFNFSRVNNKVKTSKDSEIDFSYDFFARSTNLTVSGQLEGELGATAFGEIYTFGPTFRAENSNTARHLAEFWMIEPEVAFNDLEDNANLAEEFIKYIIKYVMDNNRDDLEFLAQRSADEEKQLPQDKRNEMGLIEKLEFVLNNSFERLTYTEAIDILRESNHNKKKKFQYPVTGWGMDLQSEHERYLVEKHFKKPVILINYPKEIKAFYMRQNDDGKTVAAMDILAPGIGEIVGGSQREERLDKLLARMEEMKIPAEELWWYLDTRKFGTVPHAGFGLGFERMVQFVTGMTNIRDVIAFPRTPGSAEF